MYSFFRYWSCGITAIRRALLKMAWAWPLAQTLSRSQPSCDLSGRSGDLTRAALQPFRWRGYCRRSARRCCASWAGVWARRSSLPPQSPLRAVGRGSRYCGVVASTSAEWHASGAHQGIAWYLRIDVHRATAGDTSRGHCRQWATVQRCPMPCQRAVWRFEQLDMNSQTIAYMSRSSRGKC